MTHKSGAQIVAVAGWLSVLAAGWAAVAGADPYAVRAVMLLSALVGTAAGLLHKGEVMRQRKSATEITEELKQAAMDRIRRGRP